jgi:hypothetical protein
MKTVITSQGSFVRNNATGLNDLAYVRTYSQTYVAKYARARYAGKLPEFRGDAERAEKIAKGKAGVEATRAQRQPTAKSLPVNTTWRQPRRVVEPKGAKVRLTTAREVSMVRYRLRDLFVKVSKHPTLDAVLVESKMPKRLAHLDAHIALAYNRLNGSWQVNQIDFKSFMAVL